jgi:hypothetical protein
LSDAVERRAATAVLDAFDRGEVHWSRAWSLAAAGAALLAVVVLNWGLFSFFMRTRGPWFALRCVPLHLLYFLYSGASLALVQLAALFGVELKDGNTAR